MKITENKLKDLIRQEIAELSGVTTGKSVSRKKINPKNIKDPARPPKPKSGGRKAIKKADGGDQVNLTPLECWRNGGMVNPNTMECNMGGSSGNYRK